MESSTVTGMLLSLATTWTFNPMNMLVLQSDTRENIGLAWRTICLQRISYIATESDIVEWTVSVAIKGVECLNYSDELISPRKTTISYFTLEEWTRYHQKLIRYAVCVCGVNLDEAKHDHGDMRCALKWMSGELRAIFFIPQVLLSPSNL